MLKQIMAFILLSVSITYVCAHVHNGIAQTETHNIEYHVEIPDNYNFVKPTSAFINENGIIVIPNNEVSVGDYVSYINNNDEKNLLGRVYEKSDNDIYAYAHSIGFHEVIENGKFRFKPRVTPRLGSDHEKEHHFCVGFNTVDCQSPTVSIPIFKEKFLDITCDNCFVGFSADLFIEIDVSWFHIHRVSVGLKDMVINGALGVDIDSSYSTSYLYDKTYPIINHDNVISFNIGVIPIDVYIDLDVELIISAFLDANANLRYGTNFELNAGNAYVEWEKGHFTFHGPSDEFINTPYLTYSASLNSDAEFTVRPHLGITIDKIFEVELNAHPDAIFKLEGSVAEKNLCLTGTYEIDVNYKGHIMEDHFGETIYDSGERCFLKKCVTV